MAKKQNCWPFIVVNKTLQQVIEDENNNKDMQQTKLCREVPEEGVEAV